VEQTVNVAVNVDVNVEQTVNVDVNVEQTVNVLVKNKWRFCMLDLSILWVFIFGYIVIIFYKIL
jgi:hypothetical protein